jgi:proteasome lid subunit RPN8/RPN11
MTAMVIPAQIRLAMVNQAAFCHPEESCGLLAADSDGRLRMAYPLTNSLHSPTNYTIEPMEHYRALKHAESRGWEISGVFHSHPQSPAFPSPTDVRLAADPDWLYIVIGYEGLPEPVIRGFSIRQGAVTEHSLFFDER